MKKTKKESTPEDKINAKIDNLLSVFQDLFILEAVKAGMPVGEIRNILKINKNRIGAISKHVKLTE